MQSSPVTGAANDPAVIGSLTNVHLILIAVFALVTIAVIILAAQIRARAKRQRGDAVGASERLSQINEVQPSTTPLPPPLADTPVVATAPETSTEVIESARDAPVYSSADDLTRLKGVGPKLAAQLATLGHPSYASLAVLPAAEADALDAQLGSFKGRLARDRVVEQANYLAKGDVAGFESVFGKL